MSVAVFGLGNVLRSDDGFGCSAVARFETGWTFPPDVVLKDLGTPGLDLASQLLGLRALVLLDALEMEAKPGTIRVFHKREILDQAPQGWRTSTHQAGLRESLWVADAIGQGPRDVCLIGVVPANLTTGTGLSKEVESAIQPALEVAVTELRRLGIEAVPRPAFEHRGTWWEESIRPVGNGGA